jgi:phospholipase C
LPDTSDHEVRDEASKRLPKAVAPEMPSPLYQEKGTIFSRALPYRLHCKLQALRNENKIKLVFENKGEAGAVYHVYNLDRLEDIPKRYTVEAGKSLDDEWELSDDGKYDLEVFGPNGYFQKFYGNISMNEPEAIIDFDHKKGGISIMLKNLGDHLLRLKIVSNAYNYPDQNFFDLAPGKRWMKIWDLTKSGNWYDFSIISEDSYQYRFAGRVETGKHSISDPAMATELKKPI